MALTRAQLLQGNDTQGTVLSGEVRAVNAGTGVTISNTGVLSINTADPTFNAFMRTNAVGAFNGYIWPGSTGTVGQQLTLAAGNNLIWSDSDGIPWTTKGQLVVGTGVGTDILLNAGSNTAVLMADSFTGSGLTYSNSVTSAMLAPAGNTLQRPNPATPGQFRYNTLTGKFEFATGATSWEEIASGDPTVSTFVSQTVPSAPAGATGNALVPAGSNAQRQTSPAPVDGSMRYNTDTDELEVFGPLGWKTIPSSVSGTFVQQTAPTVGTPSAVIPAGLGTQQQTTPAPLAGYLRFNTTTLLLEVFDGFAWTPAGAPPTAGLGIDITGSLVKVAIPTASAPPAAGPGATQAVVGSMYWDDVLNQLFIYYSNGGSPVWVQAAPSASGGGGTVTGVTGTAPIVSSGGTAPAISITPATSGNAGSMSAADKAKLDGAATIVSSVSGTLPITVSSGTSTPLIGVNLATTGSTGVVQIGTNVQVAAGTISVFDSSTAQKGVIQIATQAEAITGTDATKAATPATAVAKTTADLTGFIVTPSSAVAPTTTGYLHYNTTSNHLEYFAASAAKTALEREGDNMTGKLSVTPSAITAGAGNWNLATSNYWTLGAVAVPLPTGMVAGQGGLIQVTAIPTSWPAAGGVLKYAGGTAPVIATVPAIIPYYSDGTNVYLGKATENIS